MSDVYYETKIVIKSDYDTTNGYSNDAHSKFIDTLTTLSENTSLNIHYGVFGGGIYIHNESLSTILYCHPQELVGIINEEDKHKIIDELNKLNLYVNDTTYQSDDNCEWMKDSIDSI